MTAPLEGSTALAEEFPVVVGARVRLAEAQDRDPAMQGYVIEPDKYPDRGTLVRVGFENGTSRVVHVDRLVTFGDCDPVSIDLAEWEKHAAWMRRHHGVDR